MAHLYERGGIWWIKFRDPLSKARLRESTGYRVGNGPDTRRARELEAQRTLAERQKPILTVEAEKWGRWVDPFIRRSTSGRTQERYITAWNTLKQFLAERKIDLPRHVTYANCSDYVQWRLVPDKANGKYKAGVNTAILEFKIFRWIMREAVKLGFASGNPAREVVLNRAPRKIYLEFSDADIQAIVDAIRSEPEPDRTRYERAFLMARYHGVRLNETNINPSRDARQLPDGTWQVDFFQKGGRQRTKPLHHELVPLVNKLRKQKHFYEPLPVGWGNRWTKFFRRHGIVADRPNQCFCFHGLRVTVENLLRRAKVPKELRMMYLSHEAENQDDVNALYDRVSVDEMRACHAPLNKTWK